MCRPNYTMSSLIRYLRSRLRHTLLYYSFKVPKKDVSSNQMSKVPRGAAPQVLEAGSYVARIQLVTFLCIFNGLVEDRGGGEGLHFSRAPLNLEQFKLVTPGGRPEQDQVGIFSSLLKKTLLQILQEWSLEYIWIQIQIQE